MPTTFWVRSPGASPERPARESNTSAASPTGEADDLPPLASIDQPATRKRNRPEALGYLRHLVTVAAARGAVNHADPAAHRHPSRLEQRRLELATAAAVAYEALDAAAADLAASTGGAAPAPAVVGGGDADDDPHLGAAAADDDAAAAAGSLAGPKLPSQLTYDEFMSHQQRVPRRGEGDLTAAALDALANDGYVMSGNRNRNVQKRLEYEQRVLHQKQADRQRLDLVGEEHRRGQAATFHDIRSKLRKQLSGEEGVGGVKIPDAPTGVGGGQHGAGAEGSRGQ